MVIIGGIAPGWTVACSVVHGALRILELSQDFMIGTFQTYACSVIDGTQGISTMAAARNPPSERELLAIAREALRTRFPLTWSQEKTAAGPPFDGVLALRAPDGRAARLRLEVKSVLNARDVPLIAERLAASVGNGTPTFDVVVARYLSPRAREALAAANLSYVDATGNVRLAFDDPAVFVETAGANNDPWRGPERPTNSLRGRPAARVVRALTDLRPPWKVRALAGAAGTSVGSTVRTLDFLDREALITRASSGSVIDVSWQALIQRWAADYELGRKQRLVRLIEPRNLTRLEATAETSGLRYAFSGSLAARWRAPYADPRLALLYTDDLDAMQERLGLRVSDVGTNVLLIEPVDDLVFLRTWRERNTTYAALPQVAVDLLAGPGRSPEEGAALLEWMGAHEDQWRPAR